MRPPECFMRAQKSERRRIVFVSYVLEEYTEVHYILHYVLELTSAAIADGKTESKVSEL